jgi:hypothetical protein
MAEPLTILGQMLLSIGQGASDAEIEEAAAAYLHGRYYDWIRTAQEGRGSPQSVWEDVGPTILGRCRAIGERAAASAAVITASGIEQACIQIETESETPMCPIRQP